jgi:hypothetical protein
MKAFAVKEVQNLAKNKSSFLSTERLQVILRRYKIITDKILMRDKTQVTLTFVFSEAGRTESEQGIIRRDCKSKSNGLEYYLQFCNSH